MKKLSWLIGHSAVAIFCALFLCTSSGCAQYAQCTRVIDGDTIRLETGERVRLIGIDTPETRQNPKLEGDVRALHKSSAQLIAMGKRAKEFTTLLVKGKMVRLEFDVQRHDKYARVLAYVYVVGVKEEMLPKSIDREGIMWITTPDGKKEIFLNASIVKSGYAYLLTIPPDVRYAELFKKLYKEAREQKRGLWRE